MLFMKEEKVFSLARTAVAVPPEDLTSLFEEFYCTLLVALLFREGEGPDGVSMRIPCLNEPYFEIPRGSYHHKITKQLTQLLVSRFKALQRHLDLSESERELLMRLNGIFTDDTTRFATLQGDDLLKTAIRRSFSPEMTIVARYVSVMLGQYNYPISVTVPVLYLSIFGNIHVSQEKTITLDPPRLRYNSMLNGQRVTALWSLMSSLSPSLTASGYQYPGDKFGEILSGFNFLGEADTFTDSVSAPRYASALTMQRILRIEDYHKVSLSALFYNAFLYGKVTSTGIARHGLLRNIIDVMMEKMGESRLDHLFGPESLFTSLAYSSVSNSKTSKRPSLLNYALEALDTDPDDTSTPSDPTVPSPDVPVADETDSEAPVSPNATIPSPPVQIEKDSIDLISFDKSSEGVNEDLYRTAVVALNDRLRGDDTVPVTADVKDQLDYWVNGFLYRTAISATKSLVKTLKLSAYLKNIS